MSAFPSLPLFTDAFIADTGHLTAQETGAYLMLLMVAWRTPDCRLPDDDDRLARWARVDRRTWLRIKPTVMEFWALADGSWTQKRLSKERDGVSKRADVARQNGEHGGRPKSLKNQDPANPPGSPRGTQRKASISTSIEDSLDAGAKTPIDPDWAPDDRDVDAAITEGVARSAIQREAAGFVDYCLIHRVTSHDWRASWRRWCRSPYREGGPEPRTGKPPDRGRSPPPGPGPSLAGRLIHLHEQSLQGAYDVEPPSVDANDPGAEPSRGQDLGVDWQTGGGPRPSEPLLRAVGQGGHDSRASSALRRRRAAGA